MGKLTATEMMAAFEQGTARIAAPGTAPVVIPGLNDTPAPVKVEAKPTDKEELRKVIRTRVRRSKNRDRKDKDRVLYTMWLRPDTVKAIKQKALDDDAHDYEVTQTIMDAHFKQ